MKTLSIQDWTDVKVTKAKEDGRDVIIVTGRKPAKIVADISGLNQIKEQLVQQGIAINDQLGDVKVLENLFLEKYKVGKTPTKKAKVSKQKKK